MAQTKKQRGRGTGSIYKEGKRFYFKVRINHKTKTQLLRDQNDQPVTNRQDAEKAAALLEPVLRAQQKEEIALYVAEAKNLKKSLTLTVDELWHFYLSSRKRGDLAPLTLKGQQTAVRLFVDWLKSKHPEIVHLDQINKTIAMEYSDARSMSNISAVTFNKYISYLNLVFKTISAQAEMLENPFRGIVRKSEQPISRKEFTEEQVEAIFKGFSTGFFYTTELEVLSTGRTRIRKQVTREYVPLYKDEMFVLLNLCCWTGCRGQDGCQMKWENVDWANRQITYIPEKTARKTAYRSVTLPIHPNLISALEKAKEWRAENQPGEDFILPRVAHRYQANPWGIQKDTMKIIRCATGLETMGQKSGGHRIKNPNLYSLHSFRHTFVSFCANAGVPLDVVASIVGHGSVAMTRHYAHISDAAKSKAIDALPVLKNYRNETECAEKNALIKQLSNLSVEDLQNLIRTTNSTLDVEKLSAS